MQATGSRVTIHREDYQAPAFYITQVKLEVDLDVEVTTITSTLSIHLNNNASSHVEQNNKASATSTPLTLHGEDITLLELSIDGTITNDFDVDASTLTLHHVPPRCELKIVTQCHPATNSSLMGLYVSRGNFFTQCEAEGFRKLTYFLDRPDVMARYHVTLRADKKQFPVLLANGNLIDSGDLPKGRHYACWEDPFPKPSYLFALVAGKLVHIEEAIQTASGKHRLLQVWVEPQDLNKARHALDSLIAAIRWDEERFGLELDLERFMIVAVSDFNMGAMENKGLNIFNTQYVLAEPNSATDNDYAGIESVVAHEYFHNWTGNRVTCRDWFQLSLKEGLTVFRDQEFSADRMGSAAGRAVKRIEDVRLLRQAQFAEDASPMAHPVRPESYQEINNFYTLTVYEKGAEVVRMLQTLLGQEGFRRGMDLYFQRHDGQAVTCDDFLAAMADANHADLKQFSLWYSQAGTPRVQAQGRWDQQTQTYILDFKQSCPATPNQPNKQPFHIPIAFSLLDHQGHMMPLTLQMTSAPQVASTEILLNLKEYEQRFMFSNISSLPVPSLLRNFSAPIILEYDYSEAELLHLLQYETDPFNCWEASQRLASRRILQIAQAVQKNLPLELDDAFISALSHSLNQSTLDPAFRELLLTLPSETYLAQQMSPIDPQALHQAREFTQLTLANALKEEWAGAYRSYQTPGAYTPDATSMGKRALKNKALIMLTLTEAQHWQNVALEQFQQANNMTDRFAALTALVYGCAPQAQQALAHFYQRYENDALAIDKWFRLQATCPRHAANRPAIEVVRELMQHPAFTLNNPNRVRSVIHSFCTSNLANFHSVDGTGYAFWAEQVIALDAINPQVAARLARAVERWRAFASPWKESMQAALQQVLAHDAQLSNDSREIIHKALDGS